MQKNIDRPGGDVGTLPPPEAKLSLKQLFFCDLIVDGHSYSSAYRMAYRRPKLAMEEAREQGYRVSLGKGVKAQIAYLRSKCVAKTLLSLNDRLGILADIAQSKTSKPFEKARAIEVYSKISGDQAPDRHEVTGRDGAPLMPQTPIERIPVADRIAAIRASRNRPV